MSVQMCKDTNVLLIIPGSGKLLSDPQKSLCKKEAQKKKTNMSKSLLNNNKQLLLTVLRLSIKKYKLYIGWLTPVL